MRGTITAAGLACRYAPDRTGRQARCPGAGSSGNQKVRTNLIKVGNGLIYMALPAPHARADVEYVREYRSRAVV